MSDVTSAEKAPLMGGPRSRASGDLSCTDRCAGRDGLPAHAATGADRREIRVWDGRRRDVGSPLWLREGADREPAPMVLGQSAQLTPAAAEEALAAARSAWARGSGRWPTMRIEERIEAVERFTTAMIAVRDRVCRLLMWEVGKTWSDAQGEFDRTVQYIRDTIEALKTQDRDNSRLQFREGIIAQVRRVARRDAVHGAV